MANRYQVVLEPTSPFFHVKNLNGETAPLGPVEGNVIRYIQQIVGQKEVLYYHQYPNNQ
jgi:hypothetical protein